MGRRSDETSEGEKLVPDVLLFGKRLGKGKLVARRGRGAKMRKKWRELLKSSLLCRIFKD